MDYIKIRAKGKDIKSSIITLSPSVLDSCGLMVGDDTILSVNDRKITIEKSTNVEYRGKIYSAWSKTDTKGDIKRVGAVTSIPVEIMELAGIQTGDIARVSTKKNKITLEKIRR